jgi:integrase
MPIDAEGDDNYRKILASVALFFAGQLVRTGRRLARRRRNPFLMDAVRFGLLIEFMYETGLRVSDAMHLWPKSIIVGEPCQYTTEQIKTGDEVTVFFPRELGERLKALKPFANGYVLYPGPQPWKVFARQNIWRPLKELGEAIGIDGLRPHRFRDSFAVNRLNEEMSLQRLAELLGNRSVETTRKFYSPWVKSRTNASRDAYMDARKRGAPSAYRSSSE